VLPVVDRNALDVLRFYCPGNPYLDSGDIAVVASLVYAVQARVMIEFGCNTGRTAKAVLDNVASLKMYVGIDLPAGHRPRLECQLSEVPRLPGVHARDDRRFLLLQRDSRDLSARDLPRCEAVFIDGDHSAAAVRHDTVLARELTRPGGVIIWHDYDNPTVEVTAVLDQLHADGWPIQRVENSWLAFLRT
jgi:predicted O-methyltransferase YrrM